MKIQRLTPAIFLAAAFYFHGAAAQMQNPAPAEAFSAFHAFELKPLELSPEVAADKGKKDVTSVVQTHLTSMVLPIITAWNASPTAENETTLVITPKIESIKKVGGATRFFAGALAGNSYVVMRLSVVAQPGDRVIAEPYFYQQAAAYGGAWSVGATDNDMLKRIARIAAEYLQANYHQAVGGATGRPN